MSDSYNSMNEIERLEKRLEAGERVRWKTKIEPLFHQDGSFDDFEVWVVDEEGVFIHSSLILGEDEKIPYQLRLIASAPEMLELLIHARDAIDNTEARGIPDDYNLNELWEFTDRLEKGGHWDYDMTKSKDDQKEGAGGKP